MTGRWFRRPAVLAGMAFAAGVLSTAALAAWLGHRNSSIASQRFHTLAQRITGDVAVRMRTYEYGLRGARGATLTAGIERLDRDRFRIYSASRDLDREFPGARGIGIIRRLPGERYVVTFIEPEARNAASLGLDIAGEVTRRTAARRAMESGSATLTAPLTLVQEPRERGRAFLLLLPIFRPGAPIATAGEREQATIGWSYAPLVITEVLHDLQPVGGPIALTLRDVSTSAPQTFFTPSDSGAEPTRGLITRIRLPVFGRTWEAEVRATPALLREVNLFDVRIAVASGVALSVLLAWLAAIYARGALREHRLRDDQARKAAMIHGSNDAILGATLDGVVTDWNAGAERLFGYAANNAVGRPLAELLLPPGQASRFADLRAALVRGDTVPPFDANSRHQDGSVVEISVTISPIAGGGGVMAGIALAMRDISDARRAERQVRHLNANLEAQVTERTALLESARHDLRTILDATPSMIGYWDRHLVNRFANRAYEEWFGLAPGVMIGSTMQELLGETLFDVNRPYAAAALRGEAQTFERTLPRRDGGDARHSLAHYRPDIVNGEVRGFYVLVHDITELTESRLRLVETSSLLRTVLESASEVSIIATDPDLLITVFNSGAERLLGYSSDEVIGKETPLIIHDLDEIAARAEELSGALGRTVAGSGVFTEPSSFGAPRQWTYVRKDGSRVTVLLVITAMQDERGQVLGYLGIAHDVTRQQEAEQSLRKAMHSERRANRAKSQFLANMSHEIRTPLNAVIGLSFILGRMHLDREQAATLAKISTASRTLLHVINDILDISKIEAGELIIETVEFDLRSVLHDVADVMAPLADARRIAFAVSVAPDVPDAVTGDPTRITQILTNLVSNAIKFTEVGTVRLGVECQARGEDAHVVRITVRDSGIGISPEVQSRLFAPFAQADASTTRRFGGSGLGLSIVKKLANMMGGDVGFTSTPGVGSEFWVTLPLGVASPDGQPAGRDADALSNGGGLSGIRVLVVDDSEINREVAQQILELEGAIVTLAHDGQQAVDRLRDSPHAFDIVLMDVQMPVLDGNEATRMIRKDLALADMPIVALTAGAMLSERAESTRAGMSAFVSKPVDPAVLARTIRSLVRRPPDLGAPVSDIASETEAGFPEISGIDGSRVTRTLRRSVALFENLVSRMLAEFRDLERGDSLPSMDTLHEFERRMHKLRGSAGALGAMPVYEAAGAAEEACRTGDMTVAATSIARAGNALADLRRAFGEAQRVPAMDGATRGDPEPNVALDVIALTRELDEQNVAALDRFAAMSPALRVLMGETEFSRLRDAVNSLEFQVALRTLAALPGQPGLPASSVQ